MSRGRSDDEAILLADTIYVASARPGRIQVRIRGDLPRPRGLALLTEPDFIVTPDGRPAPTRLG